MLVVQEAAIRSEREIVDWRPLQWLCSLSGPVDSGGTRLVMMKPGSSSWYSIHLIDILCNTIRLAANCFNALQN